MTMQAATEHASDGATDHASDRVLKQHVTRGFYEHAAAARAANMSAAEWEEIALADPHARVIGDRAIEAISAMNWRWDR